MIKVIGRLKESVEIECLMYGLFGFLCWCDIIVEQEDSTYPPSVEECPRTADNVQQRQTTHYILSRMFKPILLKIFSGISDCPT